MRLALAHLTVRVAIAAVRAADPLVAAGVTLLHARAMRGSAVAELMLVATAQTLRKAARP